MKPRILSRRLLIPLAGVVAAGIILLIPAFQRAYESARRSADVAPLRELGLALKKYELDHETWPISLLEPRFYSTLSPRLQAFAKNPALTYHRPNPDTKRIGTLLTLATKDGHVGFGVSGTVTFTNANSSAATEASPPERSAEVFRLVRIEPGPKRGPSRIGVFQFRYKHPQPLEFWGFRTPVGDVFTPRFTEYRLRKPSGWKPVPIGYCGTGAATYRLATGKDYELRIDLSLEFRRGEEVRVSLNSPNATFWSEPFVIPAR